MNRQQIVIALIALALLAAVPAVAAWLDRPFLVDMFARIMIFAIAAVSLDLILGYGGMVSFGHAVYIGIGAYAVGILSYYGVDNGFVQFPLALVAAAIAALVIGAMSLRTSGVYFIMITLAFAQMLYFLGISLEEFGGDDGLPTNRSEFAGLIDLYDAGQFYYLVFAACALVLYLCHRIVGSRFGMVIRGAKSNNPRMGAIGFPTYRYRLAAFVIAGAMCGLAGALFANWNEFASPGYMHWTRSGEIMIMVILGGMGTLIGPLLGAAGFLLLEEYLPEIMEAVWPGTGDHWMVVFGPMLILIVLFARGGLHALINRRAACDD
jgi:branched-chain amino acid transport system permease protein